MCEVTVAMIQTVWLEKWVDNFICTVHGCEASKWASQHGEESYRNGISVTEMFLVPLSYLLPDFIAYPKFLARPAP